MSQEAIEWGKKALKVELGRELRSKAEEILASRPGMTFQSAFDEVKKREPALIAHIARIERGDWAGSRPAAKVARICANARRRATGPVDDRQVYVIYAADGSVAGLELS